MAPACASEGFKRWFSPSAFTAEQRSVFSPRTEPIFNSPANVPHVLLQEASTNLRGKSVKCHVIKIPFKTNNDPLSPSRRYLEKILQNEGMVVALASWLPTRKVGVPCGSQLQAMTENPGPAHAASLAPFSELCYPTRGLGGRFTL